MSYIRYLRDALGMGRGGALGTPSKAPKDKTQGMRRGMLPLETVALIKRDLRTMRIVDVAHKYKLNPQRVSDIDEELNYKYVEAAKE